MYMPDQEEVGCLFLFLFLAVRFPSDVSKSPLARVTVTDVPAAHSVWRGNQRSGFGGAGGVIRQCSKGSRQKNKKEKMGLCPIFGDGAPMYR